MKITVEKQAIRYDVASCLCNKCGREMKHSFGNICGLEAYVEGCYGCDVLDDCTSYEFDLCEYCLKDLLDSFKLPVKKTEHPA